MFKYLKSIITNLFSFTFSIDRKCEMFGKIILKETQLKQNE